MKGWRPNVTGLPALLIIGVTSGLPLLWTAVVILQHPGSLADIWLSSFRLKLLASTLLYNALVAMLATIIGLPAGWVMGRNRGWMGKVMWACALGTLLLPFLAFGHGWNEAFRITRPFWKAIGVTFSPGGVSDTARCIWTLASWLWGVPAVIIGLALRRLDPDLQLAGWLDGALYRTTFRALLGPLIAAAAATMMLAAQEFAVYEPTGVRVVATEVRMVFATGAFSSAPVAGADQEQRAAAAILTATPLLLLTALLALLAAKAAGRFSMATTVHFAEWPRVLDAPMWASVLAVGLVVLTLGVPIAALMASLNHMDSPAVLFSEFGGALGGSGFLFLVVGIFAALLAFSAAASWTPGLLVASGISFLLGGEILAVALIRIFNRPGFEWAYNAWPLPAMAYLGRFGCIALLAARSTWSPAWREIRIQAAHDGAGAMTIARRMIWPLAWPVFAAAALLAGILSLGEVDVTATLVPQNPSVLTTLLLTMANASRSNRLVEGSLLAMGLVFVCLFLFLLVRHGLRFSLATFKALDGGSRAN